MIRNTNIHENSNFTVYGILNNYNIFSVLTIYECTGTYDSSRMDVSCNNQQTIDRVRDLRRRLATTHRKITKN